MFAARRLSAPRPPRYVGGFRIFVGILLAATLLYRTVDPAQAARIADVRNTAHNLSSLGSNPTRASGDPATLPDGQTQTVNTSEICVYCHTPHNATALDAQGNYIAPLWNRRVGQSAAGTPVSYTPYASNSLDSGILASPNGSSKLCLSCHDGTIALGNAATISGQGRSLSGPGGSNSGVNIPFRTVTASGAVVSATTMPDGVLADTGFTRKLGTDLSNDHPISVAYTRNLAIADGELRTGNLDPNGTETVVIDGNNLSAGGNGWLRASFNAAVARRGSGFRALLPLETSGNLSASSTPNGAGTVQCATCHDPHIRDTDAGAGNIKFLRGSRLQKRSQPGEAGYDAGNDILCLACHDKAGNIWFNSAHANNVDAEETYKRETGNSGNAYNAAAQRDLPETADTAVWQFACLNCHDTHAVPGGRRLLREGIEGNYATTAVAGKGLFRTKVGPNTPAIEETCFQCHRNRTDPVNVLNLALNQTVPDIKTDFDASLPANRGLYPLASAMPIRGVDQCGGGEKHSIGDANTSGVSAPRAGKDFVESPTSLGYRPAVQNCDSTSSRHVECTDCHNPHRAQKGNHFGTNGGTDIRGTANGNGISNALKGTVGVEPVYPADSRFGVIPTSFNLLCGSGTGQSFANCTGVVTKEYQICLKCHSNYAYNDVNDPVGDGIHAGMYDYNGRPQMGFGASTPVGSASFQGSNGVNVFPGPAGTTRYTNQAMELRPPPDHLYECNNDPCTIDGGNRPTHTLTGPYATPNHRSWHPVMGPTGRTKTERGSASVDNFTTAWTSNVGNQTMYCTDCHGRDTTTGTSNCNNTTNRAASTNTMPYIGSNDCTAGSGPRHAAGPHGSNNAFILKGKYDTQNHDLCLKCHQGLFGSRSGFCCDKDSNLHAYHRSKMSNIKCNNCHVAVPHGWKHKALLADTRTVGNEVGLATDTNVAFSNAQGYTQGPYYMNAMLKVTTWKRSGQWTQGDCNGGVNGMKSACQNN